MYRNAYITLITQDISTKRELFTPDDVLYHVPKSPQEAKQKFSILSLIPTFKRPKKEYEFILDYPELNESVIWEQNYSPLDIVESNVPDDSSLNPYVYNIIHNKYYNFHGLMTSISTYAYLDGYTGRTVDWPYAAGAYTLYENGIPGPSDSSGTIVSTEEFSAANLKSANGTFKVARLINWIHLINM